MAQNNRKGIVLAGGSATRLRPATIACSKQLLPVYDKPMIYFPLSTLMLAGIREILIISSSFYLPMFRALLGDGSQIGLDIRYAVQENPNGLAEALIIGEDFLNGSPSALVLGDNLFYGSNLAKLLMDANQKLNTNQIFTYNVSDPERYGLAYTNAEGAIEQIVEKPSDPRSNKAITGLYFLDSNASGYAKTLSPSSRGELEIIDLLTIYLKNGTLEYKEMGRGYAWLDTGTPDSLLEASNFVQAIEKRQGIKLACLEEISLNNGWMNREQLERIAKDIKSSEYGKYLTNLILAAKNAN